MTELKKQRTGMPQIHHLILHRLVFTIFNDHYEQYPALFFFKKAVRVHLSPVLPF
jgi:hypothetical protein